MARPAWPPPMTSTSRGEPSPARRSSDRLRRAGDVEAEHHAALGVLGDVAVRHPQPRIGDVEQDVHGLARRARSTVSFHTRLDSGSPSRDRTRKRPAPWTWNGWCIG